MSLKQRKISLNILILTNVVVVLTCVCGYIAYENGASRFRLQAFEALEITMVKSELDCLELIQRKLAAGNIEGIQRYINARLPSLKQRAAKAEDNPIYKAIAESLRENKEKR